MPCQAQDWVYVPSTSEELRIAKEAKIRKETKNTAELLQVVDEVTGFNVSSLYEKYLIEDSITEEPLTLLTQELCDILRNSSEDDKQRILSHPQGIYVGVWWGEHKKLDEKNNTC